MGRIELGQRRKPAPIWLMTGMLCGLQVADVTQAVRQRADALMLSGESAMGLFPEKALGVLRTVSLRIERWSREEKNHQSMRLPELSTALHERISEQISINAAQMGKLSSLTTHQV